MSYRTIARHGLARVDLITALFILLMLTSMGLGVVVKAVETRNRIRCATNLRQIGQGILLYANENKGEYPRTVYDVDHTDKPVWGTGPATAGAADPFDGKNGPDANDVSAAFFLLLRTEDITPAVFVCPSSTEHVWDYGGHANTAQNWVNWPKETLAKNLSYSYTNPYPSKAAAKSGYVLNMSLPPDFAVAADINPGSDLLTKIILDSPASQMRKCNSPNHNGDGQNILYGDGHVDFNSSPFAGVYRDNIYTYGDSGTDPKTDEPRPNGGLGTAGSPVSAGDSMLLPVAQGQASKDNL